MGLLNGLSVKRTGLRAAPLVGGIALVAVCALLDKKIAPPIPEVRFTGFECPKAFIVGYGLDYAEKYRHLPFIAELAE